MDEHQWKLTDRYGTAKRYECGRCRCVRFHDHPHDAFFGADTKTRLAEDPGCIPENQGLVALDPNDVRYNGGVRCDMAVGPCACGAWHLAEEPKQNSTKPDAALLALAEALKSLSPAEIAENLARLIEYEGQRARDDLFDGCTCGRPHQEFCGR